MKLVYEVSLLEQIQKALADAKTQNKKVVRIEVSRAEFATLMRECGETLMYKTLNLQGNTLFGHRLEIAE